MNIRFTEEFIELVIYFFCHFKQKNYMFRLAQLGRNLMLTLNSFALQFIAGVCFILEICFVPTYSEKYFDLSPVACLSSEKLDLYSVKVFLTRKEQYWCHQAWVEWVPQFICPSTPPGVLLLTGLTTLAPSLPPGQISRFYSCGMVVKPGWALVLTYTVVVMHGLPNRHP